MYWFEMDMTTLSRETQKPQMPPHWEALSGACRNDPRQIIASVRLAYLKGGKKYPVRPLPQLLDELVCLLFHFFSIEWIVKRRAQLLCKIRAQ